LTDIHRVRFSYSRRSLLWYRSLKLDNTYGTVNLTFFISRLNCQYLKKWRYALFILSQTNLVLLAPIPIARIVNCYELTAV